MKRFRFVLALVVVVLLSGMFSGCATYFAKGVMPDTNNPSLVDKAKLSTKTGEEIVVTAYPLTTEDETKKYFDENLLNDGIVAVYLEIQNNSSQSVKLITATFETNEKDAVKTVRAQAMAKEDVYGVIKRDWLLRSTVWFFTTYMIGGPVSAGATAATNQLIKNDLTEKILNFSDEIGSKKSIKGFICFRVSDGSLLSQYVFPGGLFKTILSKEGNLIEYDFPM
jgi:hypothetical protein